MKKKNRFPGGMAVCLAVAVLAAFVGCQRGEPAQVTGREESPRETNIQEENTKEENSKEESSEEENPSVIEVTRRSEEETAKGTEAASEEGEESYLLFGGDVLLSDHVLGAYEQGGGIAGILDEGYRKLIAESSFFMVNQEFPFSDRGTAAEDKQFTFRLSPKKVSVFREIGIDGVTLANNHALDFGTDALMDTTATLDEAGILHTGAGENLEKASTPVSVHLNGRKIAVIGATRVIPEAGWAAGTNHPGMLATYDPEFLLGRIRELKQEYDNVVVLVHWGIERNDQPEEYQRNLGRQYIDAGADLVIGSHPHVLQGIEYYNGTPIVYSLGNFLFGSSIPKTALLKVGFSPEEDRPVLTLIPGTSAAGFTKMELDEGKKAEFYRYIESISFHTVIEADGTVRDGM